MAVNYRRITILLAALLLSLGGLALSASLAQAAPAAPIDIPMTQPDGSVITVRQWGDEWQHGYETKGGHTILKDSASGFWVYAARQGDGSLAPALSASQKMLVVGRDNPGSLAQHVRPEATIRRSQPGSNAPSSLAPNSSSLSGPAFSPNVGNQKTLLLLVNFSNATNQTDNTASIFGDLLFGSVDSVKSFYAQASYNKLILEKAEETYGTANDGVIGWITLPSLHPTSEDQAPKVVNDVLKFVHSKGYIKFGSFDSNGDQYISENELHIILVLAGYETAYGGPDVTPSPRIWAHHWTLDGPALDGSGPGYYPFLDGVYLGQSTHDGGYAVFGEIHGDHPATMGVIAHELGHGLSWPDLYDISYQTEGVGNWSLMGGGSWNRVYIDGDRPALPDAWLKYYQGWLDPTVALSGKSYNLTSSVDNPSVLMMGANPSGVDWNFQKKRGSGEYFLVENRQLTGFDEALPGCGLLIWHIDESVTSTNDANANGSHPLVALAQADGRNHLFYGMNRGDYGDPFPGSTENRSFGHFTNPSSRKFNYFPTGSNLKINSASCATSASVTYTKPPVYTTYLPHSVGQINPNDYYGVVKVNGKVPSRPVTLNMAVSYDEGFTWLKTDITTQTDGSGAFKFDKTQVGSGAQFFVYYQNSDTNPAPYLWSFQCNVVTGDITKDSNVCNMDLGDIKPISPAYGTLVNPPVTFSWTKRPISTDSYRLVFYNLANQLTAISNPLGYTGSVSLNNLANLNIYTNTTYYWTLWVETNYGIGAAYNMMRLQFTSLTAPSLNGPALDSGITLLPGADLRPWQIPESAPRKVE